MSDLAASTTAVPMTSPPLLSEPVRVSAPQDSALGSDLSSSSSDISDSSSDGSSSGSDDDEEAEAEAKPEAEASLIHKILLVTSVYTKTDTAGAYQPRAGTRVDSGIKIMEAVRKTGGFHADDAMQKPKAHDRGYVLLHPHAKMGDTPVKLVAKKDTNQVLLYVKDKNNGGDDSWTNISLEDIKPIHNCRNTAAWVSILLDIEPVAFAAIPDLAAIAHGIRDVGKAALETVKAHEKKARADREERKRRADGKIAAVVAVTVAASEPAAGKKPASASSGLAPRGDKKRKHDDTREDDATAVAVEISRLKSEVAECKKDLVASHDEITKLKALRQTLERNLHLKMKSCDQYAAIIETLQASQRADTETDFICAKYKTDRQKLEAAPAQRPSSKKHSHARKQRREEAHSVTSEQ